MGQKSAAYNSAGTIIGFYDSIDSPVPPNLTSIEITDAEWQTCLSANPWYTVVNGVLTAPTPPTDTELLADAIVTQSAILTASCANAIVSGFQSSALGSAYTYPSQQTDQLNLTASVTSALVAASAPVWSASSNATLGQIISIGVNQACVCVTAGETGTTIPEWPTTVGTSVTDGSAVWQLWTSLFWCEDSSNNWSYAPHTIAQMQQVGMDAKTAIMNLIQKKAILLAEANAAATGAGATVAAVRAIIWS